MTKSIKVKPTRTNQLCAPQNEAISNPEQQGAGLLSLRFLIKSRIYSIIDCITPSMYPKEAGRYGAFNLIQQGPAPDTSDMELSWAYAQALSEPLKTEPPDRVLCVSVDISHSGLILQCEPYKCGILFRRLREIITLELDAESEAIFGGTFEVDESYFGGRRKGKRGRGAAGKILVFSMLIAGPQGLHEDHSQCLIPAPDAQH